MKKKSLLIVCGFLVVLGGVLFFVLREEEPVAAERFVEPDKLFEIVAANVRSHAGAEVIVEIDHARLAEEVGSPMPPSRVLIWSDPKLDTAILKLNPVAAVDLPMRTLAYEDQESGQAAVISNSYDFVAQRHALSEDAGLRESYDKALALANAGLPEGAVSSFASDTMPDPGLIVFESSYDFETTEKRVLEAIEAQSDTVIFGTVDFSERAKALGEELPPLRLILFGAPGPGGKAMSSAPTLGLDAFCQKLLILENEAGDVQVILNDLLALAERQGVGGSVPLRVINLRLKKTFSEAVAE